MRWTELRHTTLTDIQCSAVLMDENDDGMVEKVQLCSVYKVNNTVVRLCTVSTPNIKTSESTPTYRKKKSTIMSSLEC